MSGLEALTPTRRADVLAAVRAIDEAERPVPRAAFRALGDETLRAVVEEVLAASGRVLIESAGGFISGYDDVVREALAGDGIGVLPEFDRAVLTLVVLWTVAIPRARGAIAVGADWTVSEPLNPRDLSASRLPDGLVHGAVRRLRDAGILGWGARKGIVPGPQFLRLTARAQEDLFQDLVLLAEPGGALAESIRRRRSVRVTNGEIA